MKYQIIYICRMCTPVAIRKHKGPQTTQTISTRKYIKNSTLCHEKLMAWGNEISGLCSTTDVRSRDMRTPAEVASLIEWVSGFTLAPICIDIELQSSRLGVLLTCKFSLDLAQILVAYLLPKLQFSHRSPKVCNNPTQDQSIPLPDKCFLFNLPGVLSSILQMTFPTHQ